VEGVNPCPHLLFVLDLSEFNVLKFPKSVLEDNIVYMRDDLKEALKNVDVEKAFSGVEPDASKVLQRLLEILKLPRNTVVFDLTGYGLACGPVAYEVAIGIEFEEYPRQ